MPRQAREKSQSGIYHIMLRGINQQQIFEDEEDNLKFLKILADYKAVCGYQLYAYCLMGNHVHFLLREGEESLEQIMKRIGSKYVYWYNGKYRRIGHLFQDRFKSEAIDNDQYFLTVLRYIHQNPLKAKIVSKISEYRYSSYNEYINGAMVTDVEYVLQMMSLDEFIKFHQQLNQDNCLEVIEQPLRVTDEEAKRIIARISKSTNASSFQGIDLKKRDKLLRKLKEHGLSIRQISRLTGVSKGIVERT